MATDTGRRNPHGRYLPDSMLPAWNGDDLRSKLRQYDRSPFLDMLAAFLECAPDPESVLEFANKKPEAYINAVVALGRLAGFTEKREVHWTGQLDINNMSDSQVEDLFIEQAQKLGLPTLELEAVRKVAEKQK